MSDITVSQYENKAEYLRQWRAKNQDKCKAYYAKRNKEEIREKAWERRYGIKREWYDTVLKMQSGCCAICKTTKIGRKGHAYFHVDHDHDTGEVRGLLCDLCNRGLGYFKDNSKLLLEAANYLEKHNK